MPLYRHLSPTVYAIGSHAGKSSILSSACLDVHV
nr:MAG TPA: hypothetical protein [Caudoviricetes sp.]